MRIAYLIAIILFFSFSSSAQSEALRLRQLDPGALAQLGLVEKGHYYYDLGNFSEANEKFFQALDKGLMKADDYLIFANSLNSDNKIALAVEFYNEYKNLKGLEYGVIADMIDGLFSLDTSSVPPFRHISHSDQFYDISLYNGLLYSSVNGKLTSNVLTCNHELREQKIYFPMYGYVTQSGASFFNNGNSVIQSLVDTKNKRAYLAENKRGEDGWGKVKTLKFIDESHQYCSPYFDEHTNILYFSSDMPGGQGGYDIWMSYYRNGKFERPINLGPNVNTPKHELSPGIINNWLYFSSNGLPGFGGFDIYKYKAIDDFNYQLLNERKYNSKKDDYKILKVNSEDFIVNRHLNGVSNLVYFTAAVKLVEFNGKILDENGKAMQQALILMENTSSLFTRSNTMGIFSFVISSDVSEIDISVHKEGYHSKSLKIQKDRINEISLEPIKAVQIVKVVNTTEPRPDQVSYIATNIDSALQSEDVEEAELKGVSKPEEGTYYVIVSSVRDYAAAYRSWTKWNEKFEGLEIIKFNENLYRIGFATGHTELDAISELQEAIKIKNDAWIIRPGVL